jgi:hypothetical protein
MGFWKSDDLIFAWGDTLGMKFAGLANKEGVGYGGEVLSRMKTALHENARDFLSLDPQKILDEWDRMAKAARDVGVDVSEVVTVELGAAKDHLADWHGEGADKFKEHVDQIRAFTGRQYHSIMETVRALAALLRIAVQARDDFSALAQATADQVDKAFEDKAEESTEFVLKVGSGIAKGVLEVISDPKKAAFAIAETVMDIAVEGVTLAIGGDKLGDIVAAYVQQRDRLLDGYETELDEVAHLLERAQHRHLAEDASLIEPLPVTLNVNSPDFRYSSFMSKDMDPVQFGPAVERERQRFATEQQPRLMNPDSPIQQRLAGGS